MQPILIDLDGTADFLFVVRIRGVLCEAINPLRADMSIFQERVRRADHATEASLRKAIGDLAQRMIDAMFSQCEAWGRVQVLGLKNDPLSRHECIVLLYQFLACAAKARGEDLTPFANGTFSLIAEDDSSARARSEAASSLPPGRVVGAPKGAATGS